MQRKELFGPLTRCWTPCENEYTAENELVFIIPNFSAPHMHCLQGAFGPFRPNVACEVPIWMAVALKKIQKVQN